MKITLIGLGNVKGDLTVRAEEALKRCGKIIARTALTKSFEGLKGFEVQALDDAFLSCRSFDTLNKRLAACVIAEARHTDVCYCVDGAVCEDEACRLILARYPEAEVIEGVSKSSRAAGLARLKSPQYTAISAYDIGRLKSCRAAVVYDMDCEFAASGVKQVLTKYFGEETECSFIRGDEVLRIKIYEIDRMKGYDYSCAVAVEEGEFLNKERFDYSDIEELIKLLRAPGGCPWDRAQTNESIKPNVIEEAYELADAIERGDDDGIEEETGDILLQAAFHSVLKEEQGVFDGADAITRLVKKLIFRHSHVFGNEKAADSGGALSVWERNKTVEKGQKTFTDTVVAVPKNMPACMRAQKVGRRSAKCGMDFLSPVSAAEKLGEEVGELLEACIKEDKTAIFEEAGDVLYSAVNTCRLAGVDCEEALHSAVDKFIARFTEFERLATQNGEAIKDMDASRWDYYWALAKNAVKGN